MYGAIPLVPLGEFGIWEGRWGMQHFWNPGPRSPMCCTQDNDQPGASSLWENLIGLYNRFHKRPTTWYPGTGTQIE